MAVEVGLEVPAGSLAYWGARLERYGAASRRWKTGSAPACFPLIDPHGLRLALVEGRASAAPVHAVGGQHCCGRASGTRAAQRPPLGARRGDDGPLPDRRARLRARSAPRTAGRVTGFKDARARSTSAKPATSRARRLGRWHASTTWPGAWTTSSISWPCGADRERGRAARRR